MTNIFIHTKNKHMKKILLATICLFILSDTTLLAQTPGYVYCIDPAHQAYMKKARATSTNHYISVGQSGPGFANHEVLYWDANFNLLWNLNFPTVAVLGWTDIIETNDGNFIAFAANQNNNGCNIAIKITPAGTVLWQKEYYLSGTFFTSFSISKAAGNDPGFVFGGGACAASAFLVRCDEDGTILWQHEYYLPGGSGVQTTQSIIAENDAYMICGNLQIGLQFEVWITKVDSAGAWTWSNRVDEPLGNQIPVKAIKLSTGNYAMICQTNSNPNYVQYIYYFNSAGNVTGGKKFTELSSHEIYFFDLVEVSNGKVMLAGFLGESPMKSIYLELDATGNILWQKKSTGVLPGYVASDSYGIAKTATNNYAIFGASYQDGRIVAIVDSTGAGWCNGSASNVSATTLSPYTNNVTSPTIIPPNVLEMTVNHPHSTLTLSTVVHCGTLGIEDAQAQNLLLTIYPNPSHDAITIAIGDKQLLNAEITFRNVLGEQVHTLKSSSPTINISELRAGIYLIEVVMDGERIVGRVIKE
jgi:hypothetical protein